ncbi:MAG: ParB N-terminal domain-containing protein, partial [Desulfobacterales bacterium]
MQKQKTTQDTGSGLPKRKKVALGKGLDALIPGAAVSEQKESDFFYCDIDLIRPNRYQPRQSFSEEELAELTDSIKSQGILQPLLVRKDKVG